MIVVMRPGATPEQVDEVRQRIEAEGLEAFVSAGEERTVIGVVGADVDRVAHLGTMPGVEQRPARHQAVQARQRRAPPRPDPGAGARRRHRRLEAATWWSWPARARSSRDEQLMATARLGQARGRLASCAAAPSSHAPRRTPSRASACAALKLLAEAREETGLPVVSEITDPGQVELFDRLRRHAPGRQPQHAQLRAAAAVGQSSKPVLLKRGFGATIEEWLHGRRVHPLERATRT